MYRRCPKDKVKIDGVCVDKVKCAGDHRYYVPKRNICFPTKYKFASKFDIKRELDVSISNLRRRIWRLSAAKSTPKQLPTLTSTRKSKKGKSKSKLPNYTNDELTRLMEDNQIRLQREYDRIGLDRLEQGDFTREMYEEMMHYLGAPSTSKSKPKATTSVNDIQHLVRRKR